jgi:hypothetical protein
MFKLRIIAIHPCTLTANGGLNSAFLGRKTAGNSDAKTG